MTTNINFIAFCCVQHRFSFFLMAQLTIPLVRQTALQDIMDTG